MGTFTLTDRVPQDPLIATTCPSTVAFVEPLTLDPFLVTCVGHVARPVTSPGQHLLAPEDVVSCCLDLSVPSISFRINGCPVQGVFESFNLDGLFFPVVSFSAGVK